MEGQNKMTQAATPARNGNGQNTKLWWYLITVETSILVMIMIWFFGIFPGLVTKDWVAEHAPYLADKPVITRHIKTAENTLKEVLTGMQQLNINMLKQNHALEMRIQRLEVKL